MEMLKSDIFKRAIFVKTDKITSVVCVVLLVTRVAALMLLIVCTRQMTPFFNWLQQEIFY